MNDGVRQGATLLAQSLIQSQSPEVVQALAAAVAHLDDELVRSGVLAVLQTLTDQTCIDAICTVWGNTRNDELGELLAEAGWVATGPERLTFLTALKAGQLAQIEQGGAEIIAPLFQACMDADPTIAAHARLALQHLQNPAAQEELYRLVIETDHPLAREVIVTAPYMPRDPQQRALIYLLTEQWERYDELDFDRSLLQAAYQAGNEWLQRRIIDLARRAGRVEFVEVIAGSRQRRRLGEMTINEWATVLSLLNRHQSWAEMWRLAQVAPAVWSEQLLRQLRAVSWLPADPEEQTGFVELAELAAGCTPVGLQLSSSIRRQVTLAGHGGAVYDVAISPDRQLLASGSDDQTVRLWRLPDGQPLKTLTDHTSEVWSLAISPDGRLLVSEGDDNMIRLWRLPDGQVVKALSGEINGINDLVISPQPLDQQNGAWLLASAGRDHRVRLWRLPTGKVLQTLTGHTDVVICLAVSPEGEVLASGSRDNTVRLWYLADGAPLRVLRGHTGSVNSLAISPSGRLLASGSLDKTIRLWRVADGSLLKTLTGHTDAVVSLVFSPADEGLLVSGSLDQTIRLWRLADGSLLKTLEGHTDWVMSLAMSADGQLLISGSADKTIGVWSSDLARLSYIPVGQTSLEDITWAQDMVQRGKISSDERNWLKFLLAFMRWRRRFDIEVEASPHRLSIGEFDIEIEG